MLSQSSLRRVDSEPRANSDLIESQGPLPHCHAGRGRQPESRYPGPDPSLGTGYFADAKFRHDSEHVRAETALAPLYPTRRELGCGVNAVDRFCCEVATPLGLPDGRIKFGPTLASDWVSIGVPAPAMGGAG